MELDVVDIPQGLTQVHLGLPKLYFERISEKPHMYVCVCVCVCVCVRDRAYVSACA